MSIDGQRIVITGASSGLGATLAEVCAAQGARLALFARRAERLEEVAVRCRERGAEALAVSGDVTRVEDCRRLVANMIAAYEGADALIANAGMSMWARFEDVTDLEVFRRLMEVNYLGVVNCAHALLPELRKSRGMLVAVSSIQGRIGVPLHTGYVASKHALQGFCDALRMELKESGVGVLTVLPHWLRGTELRRNAFGADGNSLEESSRKHSSESISLEEASSALLMAMERRERELVIPWKLRGLLGLNHVSPAAAELLIQRAVRKQ
ncbi:MAG: SDR family oxidoreductase [Candidatus Latescibacterota bacterium]|nr:SDR family oxidoreductase [Candidatus Latescibacterota bacterium]